MKPVSLVLASFLRLIVLAPFLLSLPCVGRAQLATTATYTTNLGSGPVEDTQKLIAVGTDGYTRFIVMESNNSGYGSQLTYVRCLDLDCATYNTHSWHDNDTETLSPFEFSLAIGPDGYARIAYQVQGWFSNPDGEVTNYGILGFIQCFDDDCEISTNNDSVDYTAGGTIASVAVGNDGTAYIVYDNGNIYPGPQGSASQHVTAMVAPRQPSQLASAHGTSPQPRSLSARMGIRWLPTAM